MLCERVNPEELGKVPRHLVRDVSQNLLDPSLRFRRGMVGVRSHSTLLSGVDRLGDERE